MARAHVAIKNSNVQLHLLSRAIKNSNVQLNPTEQTFTRIHEVKKELE